MLSLLFTFLYEFLGTNHQRSRCQQPFTFHNSRLNQDHWLHFSIFYARINKVNQSSWSTIMAWQFKYHTQRIIVRNLNISQSIPLGLKKLLYWRNGPQKIVSVRHYNLFMYRYPKIHSTAAKPVRARWKTGHSKQFF